MSSLLHGHWIERDWNVIVAIEIGKGLADAGEKFFESGEAEFEGDSIAREIGRKTHARAGDDDGAARGAEIFTEFAEAAADFVVVAVAGEILEEKDGVAVDDRDVGEGLHGIVGVIERFAVKTGETFGDAPVVDGNVEFGADLKEELFDALLFGGFHDDDGMVGIDEEAKFVAFVQFRGRDAQEKAPRKFRGPALDRAADSRFDRKGTARNGCATLKREWTGLFDFTLSVP